MVLTDSDAADAATPIADALKSLLFEVLEPLDVSRREEARQVLEGLRAGTVDHDRFTPNALDWFSEQTLRDFAASLKALGGLKTLKLKSRDVRGRMDHREYDAEFDNRELTLTTRSLPDGRLEQFMLGL